MRVPLVGFVFVELFVLGTPCVGGDDTGSPGVLFRGGLFQLGNDLVAAAAALGVVVVRRNGDDILGVDLQKVIVSGMQNELFAEGLSYTYNNVLIATLGSVSKKIWTRAAFQKIKYFLMLNRYGRAKVQQENTSLPELFDLLCGVATCPDLEEEQLRKDQLLYGLLREAPAIWASTGSP